MMFMYMRMILKPFWMIRERNTKELGSIARSSIIKPKQQVKNENVLRSVMKSIGKNKSFLGKQSKNTDDAPRTKKGAGRVSPTFEEEIPIDKDDIQEDKRVLPKYDTIINMLKNAVQNIVSPSQILIREKIYPLHKTKKTLELESFSERIIYENAGKYGKPRNFKTNIRHTPIKKIQINPQNLQRNNYVQL